jgi:hypothetical protein
MLSLHSFDPNIIKLLVNDEKKKKNPCIVGFAASLLTTNELFFDVCVTSDQPIVKIESLKLYNCGTAFVTVFAANLAQSMEWLSAYKKKDECQNWFQKQHDMISKWQVILPKLQLMSVEQCQQQKKVKKPFRRLCHLTISNTIVQKGPYLVLALRCEPFAFAVQTQSDYPATFIGLDQIIVKGKKD